jgi:hypothetical protein
MSDTKMAKLLVEVQWGVIPGTVDGNEQWGFSGDDVEAAESWQTLMAAAYEEFNRRMNPRYHNWVTLTWLWT